METNQDDEFFSDSEFYQSSESDIDYNAEEEEEAYFLEQRREKIKSVFHILQHNVSVFPGVTENEEADMCAALEFVYTECKKRNWIASWPENASHVQNLIDHAIARRQCFIINVGSIDQKQGRFGVIIRDYRGKPIVAYSGYDASSLSDIYHEMQGVNKAMELAIKFKLTYIHVYCRLSGVASFLVSCQRLLHRCFCNDGKPCLERKQGYSARPIITEVEKWCEKCVLKHLTFCRSDEKEKLSGLVWEIMNKLLQLEKNRLNIMGSKMSWNYPVWCLATCGKSRRMNPWELCKNSQLTEILYKEASGESGCTVFAISE